MRFKDEHLRFFGALDGAFSVVTEREVSDSQITATGDEAHLLKAYYEKTGSPILVGNVASCRDRALKTFRLFPAGECVGLNLVFPKPAKSELRLYIASKRGYKPEAGFVWFVFEGEDRNLWLGAMNREEWAGNGLGKIEFRVHSRGAGKGNLHSGLYEENGVVYLDVVSSKVHTHAFKA